jgi:hypothetical protein
MRQDVKLTFKMRVTAAIAGATALLAATAGAVSADTVGPAIKYFQAPLPIVGSTLSDSSTAPSISVKDGWSINDGDGVCSASTQLYRGSLGSYTYPWSYSGDRTTTSVASKTTWTSKIGNYDQLYTTATDCFGNSNYAYDYVQSSLQQENAASYGPGWSTAACACWSAGGVMKSSTVGAKATYTFSGRLVSLVSNRDTNRGQVSLSIDGGAAKTVSLSGSNLNRRIVWNSNYLSTAGSHLLTIKVVSGRVDIDGFITQY